MIGNKKKMFFFAFGMFFFPLEDPDSPSTQRSLGCVSSLRPADSGASPLHKTGSPKTARLIKREHSLVVFLYKRSVPKPNQFKRFYRACIWSVGVFLIFQNIYI